MSTPDKCRVVSQDVSGGLSDAGVVLAVTPRLGRSATLPDLKQAALTALGATQDPTLVERGAC